MRVLAAPAALVLLLFAGEARAVDHSVRVAIAGDPDPRATDATLRDLFAHIADAPPPPVSLEVEVVPSIEPRAITDPPPAFRPAFARVWIDVRDDVWIVSIADASWERIYVRRVPRNAGLDEVTREQAAHVVVSAVETMLAGGTIGVVRAELASTTPVRDAVPAPPPPSPPPLPEHAERERRAGAALSLGIGYEALAFSTKAQAHGPTAAVRGALPVGSFRFGVTLGGQWRAPIVLAEAPIGLRLDAQALRLTLDVERQLTPSVAVRIATGPGLDRLEIEPRGLDRGGDGGAVAIEGKRSRITAVLRASAGVDVRVAGPVHVGIAAVLDVDPANRSYFVRLPDAPRDLLAPFAFRPGLSLGFAADVLGR